MGASDNVNGMTSLSYVIPSGNTFNVPSNIPTLSDYDFDGLDDSGAKIAAGASIAS